MLFKELILKKRLGKELTENEINWFISNLTSNHLSEGQIASLAMALTPPLVKFSSTSSISNIF